VSPRVAFVCGGWGVFAGLRRTSARARVYANGGWVDGWMNGYAVRLHARVVSFLVGVVGPRRVHDPGSQETGRTGCQWERGLLLLHYTP
jgi:hypothetical protein